MLHFELAYYLQNLTDSEFFAVIDIPNNPKKMFLKQKFVNFEKTWFFHDHVKKVKTKPDLEYIEYFEKKYDIDLWKIAINERFFYRFNRFYKFSKNEILQILEQECKLFEKIIDEVKPDFFLTYDPPFHYQKLFLDLCKAKGVKILCLYYTRVGSSTILASDGTTFDLDYDVDLNKLDESSLKNKTEKRSEYSKITESYKFKRKPTISNKIKALIDFIIFSDSKNAHSNFTYYGRNKMKVIVDSILLILKRKYRERFMNKHFIKETIKDFKYIYFPMNIEEELSVLHYTPFFTNQIEVIRHVAKSLPIDYQLVVKEHPFAEFRGWHTIREYKEIMDLKNVTVVHHSISSEKLMENSELVITLRGTASFDCLNYKKPSIIFGQVSFGNIPSVFTVSELDELPKIIRSAIKSQVNDEDIEKYIQIIKKNEIDFSMMEWEVLRNNYFFSGNTLSDVEISNEQVQEFFNITKQYFKPLVDAHLEKINI